MITKNDTMRWGYVDKDGEMIIKPSFGWATSFSDDLAAVLTDEGWGYIDRSGGMVVPSQFIQAGPFADGLAPVCTEEGCGYIGRPGE